MKYIGCLEPLSMHLYFRRNFFTFLVCSLLFAFLEVVCRFLLFSSCFNFTFRLNIGHMLPWQYLCGILILTHTSSFPSVLFLAIVGLKNSLAAAGLSALSWQNG